MRELCVVPLKPLFHTCSKFSVANLRGDVFNPESAHSKISFVKFFVPGNLLLFLVNYLFVNLTKRETGKICFHVTVLNC